MGEIWYDGQRLEGLHDARVGELVATARFLAERGETKVVTFAKRGGGATALLVGVGIALRGEAVDLDVFTAAYEAQLEVLRADVNGDVETDPAGR